MIVKCLKKISWVIGKRWKGTTKNKVLELYWNWKVETVEVVARFLANIFIKFIPKPNFLSNNRSFYSFDKFY